MNTTSIILSVFIATMSLIGAIVSIVLAFKTAKKNADVIISKNRKHYMSLKSDVGTKPLTLAK